MKIMATRIVPPIQLLLLPRQPDMMKLYQNFPNPFNNETIIEFELSDYSIVTIQIYNTSDSLITKLIDNISFSKCNHKIKFRSENLPSGIYYYIIKSDHCHPITRKICLIK